MAEFEQLRVGVFEQLNGGRRAFRSVIRQGGYKPDAGQLAEKIVQAAEVDARLKVIFGG